GATVNDQKIKCSDCIFSTVLNSDKNLYRCDKGEMTDYNGLTERSCYEFKHKTDPAEVLQIEDNKRRYNEALRDYASEVNREHSKSVMVETINKLNAMGKKAKPEEIQRGFELCIT
ncbi:MAG TPA: hypothetical protein PKJ95_08390, partial [Atribacterota bacterium]|nr:hypothetical protein [Atribacterota bacterium]